jgi:Skp family chaperone for outer membrane proteins
MTPMKLTLLAGLALTLLSAEALAQAPVTEFPSVRVAFFDSERVASESVIGMAGLARLEEFRRSRDQEAQEKNRELEEARESLRQAASVLSPEVLRDRERTVQNFELDLQRFMEDAQAEFLGVQREVITYVLLRR